MNKLLFILPLALLVASCGRRDYKDSKKDDSFDFRIDLGGDDEEGIVPKLGVEINGNMLEMRPRSVLMTANENHRLTPIFKVNYDERKKRRFSGTNSFHYNYSGYSDDDDNNWNGNFMPGFEAVHGYNMLNVSHFNTETASQHNLFDHPVLVNTLYFPAFSKDTLQGSPISRDYYLVSVYDEDSNKDGWINDKDLRRLYHFDVNGENPLSIVPKNHSVMSSEYDHLIDYMYIFTKEDENGNGQMELIEPTHVFWIDLADPSKHGKMYEGA